MKEIVISREIIPQGLRKPDGLFVTQADEVDSFSPAVADDWLTGVGKVTGGQGLKNSE